MDWLRDIVSQIDHIVRSRFLLGKRNVESDVVAAELSYTVLLLDMMFIECGLQVTRRTTTT